MVPNVIRGVDLSQLPEQFGSNPGSGSNVTLVLDADGAAYRAAIKRATLKGAVSCFITEVLETMYVCGAGTASLHLTHGDSRKLNRPLYPSAKPYQGNRTGKGRPPLLEPLREVLAHPETPYDMGMPETWTVTYDYWAEADDNCTSESYRMRDLSVVASDDKDLRMCRGPYFEANQGRVSKIDNAFGYIDFRPQDKNPIGHGTKWFWLQMLMGDTADNIKGINKLHGKNCGKVGAYDFLSGITSEDEAANEIIAAYGSIRQDVLAEAQLLWMRRWRGDCAYTYLTELDLTERNRNYINRLHERHLLIFERARNEEAE